MLDLGIIGWGGVDPMQRRERVLIQSFPFKAVGPRVLLVIDECQHLDAKMIECLRALFDLGRLARDFYGNKAAFGLLLVGNGHFLARGGRAERAAFEAILSRCPIEVTLERPVAEEFSELAQAYFPDSPELKQALFSHGELHGTLRAMATAFSLARNFAGDGEVTFTIKNRKFESTIEISRDDIADDRLGIFKPAITEMGQAAKRHPDELIFDLLAKGFTSTCYDGQSFFDTDHPISDGAEGFTPAANTDGGSGPAWFLLDTTRGVRPMIWQEREKYEFQQLTRNEDDYVFHNDKYLYGLRARVNAGFGLWQLAWGAKQDLTSTTYAAARAAMMSFTADGGRKLGITPNVLVVPPALEEKALYLLNTEIKEAGGSNPWKGTAKVIVTPYLA